MKSFEVEEANLSAVMETLVDQDDAVYSELLAKAIVLCFYLSNQKRLTKNKHKRIVDRG